MKGFEIEYEKSLDGLVSLILYLDEDTKITKNLGLISLSNPIWCHFQDIPGEEQIQENGDCQEFRFYCTA